MFYFFDCLVVMCVVQSTSMHESKILRTWLIRNTLNDHSKQVQLWKGYIWQGRFAPCYEGVSYLHKQTTYSLYASHSQQMKQSILIDGSKMNFELLFLICIKFQMPGSNGSLKSKCLLNKFVEFTWYFTRCIIVCFSIL